MAKAHASDGTELIPTAKGFAATLFHERKFERRESPSLAEARALGELMVAEFGSNRRAIVYAILDNGQSVVVPKDYELPTQPKEDEAMKETIKTAERRKPSKPLRRAAAKPAVKVNKSEIVHQMLTSKTGATREELSAATGWPRVNLNVAAGRAGMELREKDGRYRLVKPKAATA